MNLDPTWDPSDQSSRIYLFRAEFSPYNGAVLHRAQEILGRMGIFTSTRNGDFHFRTTPEKVQEFEKAMDLIFRGRYAVEPNEGAKEPSARFPGEEPDQQRMARATGKMAIAYTFEIGLNQADEVRKILGSFLRDEATDARVIASVASATTLVVVVEDKRETRTSSTASAARENWDAQRFGGGRFF